ncbi:hypothetical protein [Lysinibacillus sp. NPDC047702]
MVSEKIQAQKCEVEIARRDDRGGDVRSSEEVTVTAMERRDIIIQLEN